MSDEGFFLVPTSDAPRGKLLPGDRRDSEAARLIALGWDQQEIADRLGYADSGAAVKAAQRAMAIAVRFARDEQRYMELRGLNEIEVRLWKLLETDVTLVQHGRIVIIDDAPMVDHRFALEVIDRILHVKAQRAKLLDLNAPTRIETITLTSVEEEIMRLEEDLRRQITS
jgi:hypothetical protein